MNKSCRILYILFLVNIGALVAQPDTDLSKLLDEELNSKPTIDYATATFKTTRLLNGHSNEHVAGGVMDFRISHRFGAFNTGLYNFFGLDQASMRMALEYGITNWWMIGGGRSTYEKTYDGFTKFKLLRQSTGKRNMPISLNYLASMAIKTVRFADPNRTNYATSNFFYTHQLIIARKFSESLSFQLLPTLVHRNLVALKTDKHDLLALGFGGRVKLSRRVSINAEYFYQFDKLPGTQNCLSIGVDIETGGHVFQLIFTNASAMVEHAFITQTVGNWSKGDVIGGFNISRVFTIVDPRKHGRKNPDVKDK
jgi:hypothetical protein